MYILSKCMKVGIHFSLLTYLNTNMKNNNLSNCSCSHLPVKIFGGKSMISV